MQNVQYQRKLLEKTLVTWAAFFFYKSMVCVIQSPKLLPIQCHPMLPANSRMSDRTWIVVVLCCLISRGSEHLTIESSFFCDLFILIICALVFFLHICLCEGIDYARIGITTAVSCHVGTWNWTWVLWTSS